ncbi:LysR family transcriptional regulator [Cognatishimia sp. SS12]|uniref:LysR family transcriptional regulator n=1 Tax=Cognatishimia sp. SS12 TaxID=2979465 RepID=UPI00232AFF8F|nr:LysR family transcriptional regulator [Cognatishimia sp. SS12]MDC0739353.1 LysR family transcriptional regulator [Cognatishimia sp. SS12]
MYSIEDLQTFVAIAQRGGITAAANSQGLSPATVSHRLTKLEKHLGVTLFHRTSRTVTLSTEGEAFFNEVETILETLADAELNIGSHGGKLRGHLRVTMAPWILSRFILPNLPRLQQAEPGLTFEFLAVDRFVNLAEERQDCAIRVGKLADSSFLSRKLADNRRILCAAPAYLAQQGTPGALADLAQHKAVCLPWQRDWGLGAHMPQIHVVVSNSDTLTDAATHGVGIALKSELAVAQELATGQLVEVLPGALPASAAPISSLRLPHLKDSRKVDAFVQFCFSCFASAD